MPEQTPERLRAFRQTYQRPSGLGPRSFVINLVVALVAIAATVGTSSLWGKADLKGISVSVNSGGLSPAQMREYAVYLEQKELPDKALGVYQDYLAKAVLTDEERAQVCYSVGKLAADAGQYEDALAYLYQAEILNPQSELSGEVDKLIVSSLERLGRTADLRRELRKRTDVNRDPADLQDETEVLARFNDQVITARDLEQEMERLPAPIREEASDPKSKRQLLENMIAERLLLEKAYRLGLDEDPEIEQQLKELHDSLIVRKLIAGEVQDKLNVTPEEVARFYETEKERLGQPASAQVVIGRADAPEADFAFDESPVKVLQGRPIPGLPASGEAAALIFEMAEGETTLPLEIDGAFYRFQVLSKQPGHVLSLEEARPMIEKMLNAEKEQAAVKSLIEETLRAHDVQIYPERLGLPEDGA